MSRVFIFTRSSVYRTSNEFDQIPSVNINYSKASLSALLCWVLFFSLNLAASESQIEVHVLNYVRAKTAVHFDSVIARSGGINQWTHTREPQPIGQQRVKRMNRDTLYSSAVVDISKGAIIKLPEAGSRYMSAVVVNEDHFINNIYHGPGEQHLELSEFDTPFVLITVRTLVDASDPRDIKQANALQDELEIESQSANAYTHPPYDQESLAATAKPLLELAAGLKDAKNTFGKKEEVNKVRHLLATAYGWGGLPESEAVYLNVQPDLPVGAYSLTVNDVPVDGFWSISVYNKDGYFEKNSYDSYSISNLTAEKNPDGSVTVNFGGDPYQANFIPITDGWNYVVRMYRPRPSIIDRSWTFPSLE